MSFLRIPQILFRPVPGFLILFGGGTAGGYAYRSYATSGEDSGALNQHGFSPYTLVSKKPVSSTSSIFTLRPRYTDEDSKSILQQACKKGIWSVQAKQPQLQIARSYTPLPSTSEETESNHHLRILIRREKSGEVSNYLHKLPEEATLNLRGPFMELEIPKNATEILFLAGGTGIAPALQVAKLLEERKDMKVHILWANRRREDCIGGKSDVHHLPSSGLLSGFKGIFGSQQTSSTSSATPGEVYEASVVQEINKLKSRSRSGSLMVEYFVDEEGSFVKDGNVLQHVKHLAKDDVTNQASLGEKYILVSGPDGFVKHLAGEKVWVGGREAQGPLGGVLSKMNLPGWKIIKL
ncbi:hypothetical protein E2P81_ATG07222 [Venturia nashicola]|uniref:FAD-binding FR-type domain-containing protein n=1 Tax=Venturia nashicola TaxID=86259 RepID=A0A4Z1P6D4_9PEZI|nr:hypothetical protein E6O75_ATG07385 [Venturia nashicola]TLD31732.1 hypothetical protein E2P81_ATG07222 [Venturia nashicola]